MRKFHNPISEGIHREECIICSGKTFRKSRIYKTVIIRTSLINYIINLTADFLFVNYLTNMSVTQIT
jgi:hypothetical protein